MYQLNLAPIGSRLILAGLVAMFPSMVWANDLDDNPLDGKPVRVVNGKRYVEIKFEDAVDIIQIKKFFFKDQNCVYKGNNFSGKRVVVQGRLSHTTNMYPATMNGRTFDALFRPDVTKFSTVLGSNFPIETTGVKAYVDKLSKKYSCDASKLTACKVKFYGAFVYGRAIVKNFYNGQELYQNPACYIRIEQISFLGVKDAKSEGAEIVFDGVSILGKLGLALSK